MNLKAGYTASTQNSNDVPKLLTPLLTRFAAFTLAFAVASCAALLWQAIPAFRSLPASSVKLLAVLSRADVPNGIGAEGAGATAYHYWVLRRSVPDAQPDMMRPVPIYKRGDNRLTFHCVTITVSVDNERRLFMHGESIGSLNDPSALGAKLKGFFREREIYRAYKQGMEERADLPPSERIDRTVIIYPAASLKYGEILELVSYLERAGVSPVVLQIDGDRDIPCLAMEE